MSATPSIVWQHLVAANSANTSTAFMWSNPGLLPGPPPTVTMPAGDTLKASVLTMGNDSTIYTIGTLVNAGSDAFQLTSGTMADLDVGMFVAPVVEAAPPNGVPNGLAIVGINQPTSGSLQLGGGLWIYTQPASTTIAPSLSVIDEYPYGQLAATVTPSTGVTIVDWNYDDTGSQVTGNGSSMSNSGGQAAAFLRDHIRQRGELHGQCGLHQHRPRLLQRLELARRDDCVRRRMSSRAMRQAHRRLAVGLIAAVAVLGVAGPAAAKSDRHKLPQCVVPKLTGDTLAAARKQLVHAHCRLGSISGSRAGVVQSQSPAPGTRRHAATRVRLVMRAVLTPTATSLEVVQETTDSPYGLYFIVGGTLDYDIDRQLNGIPLTFRISDQTAGTVLGSFSEPSNAAACTITASTSSDGSTVTLAGDPVTPYQGCPFGSINLPAADVSEIKASFGGNSKYAPSVSLPGALA